MDPKFELTRNKPYLTKNFRQSYLFFMTSLSNQKSVDPQSTLAEVHATQTESTRNDV